MAVSKDGGLNLIEQPNSQIHGENNDEPRGLRGIQFSDKAASVFFGVTSPQSLARLDAAGLEYVGIQRVVFGMVIEQINGHCYYLWS